MLAGLDELINEAESADQKLPVIMREFMSRPDLAEVFNAVVSSMRESEEKVPLEESIRLYGVQNTVFFLVTYKLSEVYSSCKIMTKDPQTHRLLAAPSQVLKYAHSARIAIGEDGRYRDSSFAAGLLFDMLGFTIVTDIEADQKKHLEFLDQRFNRGILVANTAVKIARDKKQLRQEKHLVAACLIREAAKVAMAYCNAEYLEFMKNCEKAKISLAIRNLAEVNRFGGTSASVAQLICLCFEMFAPANRALSRCDTPFMFLAEKKLDDFDLAALCFLSAHLTREAMEKPKGNILAGTLRPEIRELDLRLDFDRIFKKEGGK